MDKSREQRWCLGALALWLCAAVAAADHYTVPLFVPAATLGAPQGVLRILNGNDASGTVTVYGIDDAGTRSGPATFTLNSRAAAEFTATELANGSAASGLTGSLGAGTGDWRIEIETDLPIEPLAYVRAADGTLSVMHDTVRGTEVAGRSTYLVPIFNPSTEVTQTSRLRLINPGEVETTITIGGRDDTGAAASGGEVQLTIPAGGARSLTAQQLEAGDASVTGQLGAGVGRWRLSVLADRPIQVVNVAVTSAGVWNNLSTTAVRGPAPSDHGAFNERFTGLGVVYETDSGRFTLSPQAGDRFTETGEADGMAVSHSGDYRYTDIGPDAGRLTLKYDDGNACAANFYFSSRTGGWFASHCTGSDHPDGRWLGGSWYVNDGVNTSPMFAEDGPEAQSYRTATAIDKLTLPAATGMDGNLTYSLSPDVPGLSFDGETRELSGTPAEAGRYAMTYTVTDSDGDTATLSFTVTVVSSDADAAGVCYVGLIVGVGQSCTYPGTEDEFSVNVRGRGRFLDRLAGIRIRINNETIGGRVYDFEASHQGDGVWRIDRVAGSTESPTGRRDSIDTGTGGGGTDMGTGSDGVTGPLAYATGAVILDLPVANWIPDVTSDAGAVIGDDDVEIEFNNGGYIEEGAYRYTCVGVDGCVIGNRTVQDGLIVQTPLTDHENPPSIYAGGAEIADLPAGYWFPDVASEAGAGVEDDDVLIQFNTGGYIDEGVYRYTCLGVSGCLISNRTVLDGAIVQTPLTAQENRPSTGGTARSGASSYAGGAAIADLPAGAWFPDTASDAEAIVEDGELAVVLSDGGYIEEGVYRYTCRRSEGCKIGRRDVLYGPIVQTPVPVEETPPAVGSAASDRAVLEALYHATGGEHWRRSDNWLSEAPLDQWYGVVTDGDGRVTSVGLANNGLRGTIPPEFWQLDALQELGLGENGLTGSITPEIGELHDLRRVDFGRTQLTGTVPWAMWERIEQGDLEMPFWETFIHGVGAPPQQELRRVFSADPAINGNASHRSVAYYQGPLVWRREWGLEPEELQRPVLGRWAAIAVRIDHHIPEPPLVITRVLDSEGSVLVERLAEAAPPTTANHGPSLWRTTYVFDLPGEFYQAGNQIVHVIDPDGELAETDESDNVTDPVTLYGVRLPPFRITFVPLHYPGEPAPDFDPADLVAESLAFYPIADDYQAVMAAPVESVAENDSELKAQVTALWNANADPYEFYHGIVMNPWPPGSEMWAGLATSEGQLAVSGLPSPFIIAHELGHNLSLDHSPDCEWRDVDVDQDYPYTKGGLGHHEGWDANWRRFVYPADGFSDIMSICANPGFLSDYSYGKALEFRLRTGGPVGATAAQPLGQGVGGPRWSPQRADQPTDTHQAIPDSGSGGGLALSGRVDEAGLWSLTHAQGTEKGPRAPWADGEFTLILFDADGMELYREPLSVTAFSHHGEAVWAARTPKPSRPIGEVAILNSQGETVLSEALSAMP